MKIFWYHNKEAEYYIIKNNDIRVIYNNGGKDNTFSNAVERYRVNLSKQIEKLQNVLDALDSPDNYVEVDEDEIPLGQSKYSEYF